MIGIYAASLFKLTPLPAYILTAALLISAAVFSSRKALSFFLVSIAIISFGASVFSLSDILPEGHISGFTRGGDKTVYIRGRIVDDPVVKKTIYKKEKASFLLEAGLIKDGDLWHRARGLVKVGLYSNPSAFSYGDEVLLEGILYRPEGLSNPGLFDYSKYLSMKGVTAAFKVKEWFLAESLEGPLPNPLKKAAYSVRHAVRGMLDRYLKDPYRGFLTAILIGDRTELNKSLRDDFVKTGTVHVIAISGLHVGIIAAAILGILALFGVPKKINLVVTFAALVFYALVAGANPPIIRAVIMFAIFTAGYLMRRDNDVLNSLSLAAFLILLYNPRELFNPGFQLSFVSVASIILLTPRIEKALGLNASKDGRFRVYTIRALSVSLAASAGTWPIVASYFNIVSPIAILANLIVVPLLVLLTAISFVFLILGGAIAFVAGHLAVLVTLAQKAIFLVNHILSNVPLGHLRVPSPPAVIIILYYSLVFLLFAPEKITAAGRPIKRNHLIILVLVALNIFVWRDVVCPAAEEPGILFFDVGHGDSALVTLSGDINILIDAGSGGEEGRFDMGRNVIAPYLWKNNITKLDLVIVTHLHEDHLGGIPYLLENFKIGVVVDNGLISPKANRLSRRYIKLLRSEKVEHLSVERGDLIRIGDADIYVLNPGQREKSLGPNDRSVVTKISAPEFTALFTGDITSFAMTGIFSCKDLLKTDILKVPHHGGRLGDMEIVDRFFETVSPETAVISCSSKEAAAGRVDLPDSKIYLTGTHGAVKILALSDGDIEIIENKRNN